MLYMNISDYMADRCRVFNNLTAIITITIRRKISNDSNGNGKVMNGFPCKYGDTTFFPSFDLYLPMNEKDHRRSP